MSGQSRLFVFRHPMAEAFFTVGHSGNKGMTNTKLAFTVITSHFKVQTTPEIHFLGISLKMSLKLKTGSF